MRLAFIFLLALILAIVFGGCSRIVVDDYQALALTTYTWRVEYFISRNKINPRVEEFASSSLLNIDGEKPDGAFGGKDDRELWWGRIPPKPSLDQIEELEEVGENHRPPSLLRTVDFSLQYQYQGQAFKLLSSPKTSFKIKYQHVTKDKY